MNEEKRLQQVYNILDKFEENFLYKLKGIYQSREKYFSQRLENYYYTLINNLGFEKYFQELLLLLFREGMKLGQNHASFEIEMLQMKDPFEKQTKSAMQYWDDYAIKLSKVEDKDLLNKLKETLQKGMKEGKTIQELQRDIKTVFPEFTKARLENIARTETAKAYNYGRLLTFYENTDLVQAVKISAIIDDRTCDICISRNGMIIPLSDTGAVARNYPPFHYQCRCVLLPITIVDKRKPNYKERKYQNIPEPLEGFGLPDLSMITKAKPPLRIKNISEIDSLINEKELETLRFGEEKKRELGICVRDGKEIWRKKGEAHSIEIRGEDISYLKHSIFIHNHPRGLALSLDDLKAMLTYNVKEMRAIGMPKYLPTNRKITFRYTMSVGQGHKPGYNCL